MYCINIGDRMKNLAIIPARSGSKGLHDKNIKIFNGIPLLAYTIAAAIESKQFEEIFVSTDSERYAKIAEEFGANVPFLRSSQNAGDDASSWDVVREVLKNYADLGKIFDTIALLQPTSPLRGSKEIIEGYQLFEKKKANSVVAVCEVDYSPLLCNILGEDLSMENFIRKDIYLKPRQQLPIYYRINGALYIIKVKNACDIFDLYDERGFAYVMDREKSVDIDTEFDFIIAEKYQNIVNSKFPNVF